MSCTHRSQLASYLQLWATALAWLHRFSPWHLFVWIPSLLIIYFCPILTLPRQLQLSAVIRIFKCSLYKEVCGWPAHMEPRGACSYLFQKKSKRFVSLDSPVVNRKLTLGIPWRQARNPFFGQSRALVDFLATPQKQLKLIPRKRALGSLVKS